MNSKYLSIIESILFAAGEPVPKRDLEKALSVGESELEECLIDLERRYQEAESGLKLSQTETSVQLVTKPENFESIKRCLKLDRSTHLSRAAAEVLAILAYHAPITRIEIDAIRGVNSSGVLQRLVDQGLVCECGRKDVAGKPYLYKTTDEFLRAVGIQKLEDLPPYESFKTN